MTRRAQREAVLVAGLLGTFVIVLGGVWSLASRVWSTSFTQTLEVMVAAPFLAAWALAPLFWAARPRAHHPDAAGSIRPVLVAVALVSVGLVGYGATFVVEPWITGSRLGTNALLAVLLVPCVQWATLAIDAAVARVGAG